MDTSETYIKMCERADLKPHNSEHDRQWQDGDCYFLDEKVDVYTFWHYPTHIYNAIWLPRQDQLQEMVDGDVYEKVCNFYDFVNDVVGWELMKYKLKEDYFTSMEQLWLAFVMKEKINKTWNGEDWI